MNAQAAQTLFILGNAAFEYASQYVADVLEKKRFSEALQAGLNKKSFIMPASFNPLHDGESELFVSSNLPYATTICVLPESFMPDAVSNMLVDEFKKVDSWNRKVLLVEKFPFGKGQVASVLRTIKYEFPEMDTRVLFWNEKRRFGYTDISDDENSQRIAKVKYEEIFPGCVTNAADIAAVASRCSVTAYFLSEMKRKMQGLEKELGDFFNLFKSDTNIFNAREDVTDQSKMKAYFCGYKRLDDAKPVSKSYIKNYTRYIEQQDSDFYKGITAFYKQMVGPLCIWDMEKDITTLHTEIKEAFLNVTKGISNNNTKKPGTELEYRKDPDKIQIEFKKLINENSEFWGTIIPDTIKAQIKDRYDRLEKLFSKNKQYQTLLNEGDFL